MVTYLRLEILYLKLDDDELCNNGLLLDGVLEELVIGLNIVCLQIKQNLR